MISERFYATCSTTEPCNCFQTPDKPLSGAPVLSSFRLLACLQNKNVFPLQSLKSSLQKKQPVCDRNIFSFHQKTNAASCCVPRMVVRVSMVWRGKMWQCHLVNQWVSILQQADAFQLFPRQAELSFQGRTAAPMHLPAPHTHSLWARSSSMSCGYGTSLRMSHPEQKSQPQPCKPRRSQLTRVGARPCRNQSHSPPADVTGPWDLSFTCHPGSSGLPWHLFLLCFLSSGARHCYMFWQFYPLPCPCTVSLRGQKAISQTALLCLLTEGSYGLTVPFQRKKIPNKLCTCSCFSKPFHHPQLTALQRPNWRAEILSIIPVSWELSRVISYYFTQDSVSQAFIRYVKHFHSSWLRK